MSRGRPTTDTVTLHVPFRIVKRGGRKQMLLPPETAAERPRTDDTLAKALARAFRWKRMLDSGEFATVAELAEREGIAASYLTRVLRLTLLAPQIVEAILDGRQPAGVTLETLREPPPARWQAQMNWLHSKSSLAEHASHPLPSVIASSYMPTNDESK
jgi:hypothetical protein